VGCNANRGRASIRSPARPSVIRNHRQTLSRLFRRPANTFQGEYERVSVAWRFSGKGTVDSNIFSTIQGSSTAAQATSVPRHPFIQSYLTWVGEGAALSTSHTTRPDV